MASIEDAALDQGGAEIDRDWSARDRDFSAGDRADLVEARNRGPGSG